jgi:hypothetical protein
MHTLFKSFMGGSTTVCLLCFKDEIVIPTSLTKQIVQWYHYLLCHPSINRTEETIGQHFYWPKMREQITNDISTCWQKLHSHVYTRAMVCSFVSFTHYLIYLRRWIAKKICLWCCLFASFVSFSQLIIVIWIKTSVGITTVFHTGISKAVAAA